MTDNSIEFDNHILSVRKFSESGNVDMALKMLDIMETAYPQERSALIREKAIVYLDSGKKKDALLQLCKLFDEYHEVDVFETVKDKFDFSEGQTRELYQRNIEILKSYEHKYISESLERDCSGSLVWNDEDLIVCVNETDKEIRYFTRQDIKGALSSFSGNAVFAEAVLFCDQIKSLKEATKIPGAINGMELPLYLAFDFFEWNIFLQAVDLSEVVADKRCVFMVDKQGVDECFSDLSMIIPDNALSFSAGGLKFEAEIENNIKEREEELKETKERVYKYYRDNGEEINNRIKAGKPRILFWTCRFTTVLQYHTRDMMEAAKSLGCESLYLIERDDISRITPNLEAKVFDEFKPDVVFCINHFRFENDICNAEHLLYVTWIQDPSEQILDPETRNKLTSKDIILNHLTGTKEILDLYKGILIDAPVPANHNIYKTYELTEEEKVKYSADICFVCHASDVDGWISNTLEFYRKNGLGEEIIKVITEIFDSYKKRAKTGQFFYRRSEFSDFIINKFSEEGYEVNAQGIYLIADDMYKWLNQRLFRQILVDWIIEAGFTNIKLWGNGWRDNPKYADYAMGAAENGEVLSKIYQSSKIVVGNNIITTAAARAWESMLSGAFYLSNYIPEDADYCDIRKIIPEGTIEFFHDRQELIEKINFYLKNDTKRKEMIEKGRQEVLKKMTFEALMGKLLDIMPEHL